MAVEGFRLGVDFGTSNTVAVLRWPDGRAKPLLFDGSPMLPSAVYAEPSGGLAVGRDAQHSARMDPARYEPNPKRRVDDGWVLLGDREVSVVDLIAAVLGRVVDEARRTAGGVPPTVTVTCPAVWGTPRRRVLGAAAARAGLGEVRLLEEPVAAATYFARVLGQRMGQGSVVVVYDLGGGTFDVSLVERVGDGFRTVDVDGRDDIGGLDLDERLVRRIGDAYGAADPAAWQRLANPTTTDERRQRRLLWDDVRGAKERLSRHANADLHVPLLNRDAHITREEFEALAGPLVTETVRLTATVLDRAAVPRDRVAGVFLVGGSSRIPLVATEVHRALKLAPTVIEQPELVVAEGSVLAPGADVTGGPTMVATAPPPQSAIYPTAPISGTPSAPVSGAPISGAPISGAPISGAPVSGSPVSGAPMSGAPMSASPVSGAPMSGGPTMPTSGPPATPVSGGPVSGGPVSGAPVSGAPVSGGQVYGTPVAQAPGGPVPGAQVSPGVPVWPTTPAAQPPYQPPTPPPPSYRQDPAASPQPSYQPPAPPPQPPTYQPAAPPQSPQQPTYQPPAAPPQQPSYQPAAQSRPAEAAPTRPYPRPAPADTGGGRANGHPYQGTRSRRGPWVVAALVVVAMLVGGYLIFTNWPKDKGGGNTGSGADPSASTGGSSGSEEELPDVLYDKADAGDAGDRTPVVHDRFGNTHALPAGGPVRNVIAVPSGLVASRNGPDGKINKVQYLDDQGAPKRTAESGVTGFHVNSTGKAVAVSTASQVTVWNLEGGADASADKFTPIPTDVQVAGWVGELVMIRVSPGHFDYWDPGSGPYKKTNSAALTPLGGRSDGHTLLGVDQQGCLVSFDVSAAFATGRNACSHGLELTTGQNALLPILSPDGEILIAHKGADIVAVAVEKLFEGAGVTTRLQVDGRDPGIGWVTWGKDAVHLRTSAGTFVRCKFDTGACTTVNVPADDSGLRPTRLVVRFGG